MIVALSGCGNDGKSDSPPMVVNANSDNDTSIGSANETGNTQSLDENSNDTGSVNTASTTAPSSDATSTETGNMEGASTTSAVSASMVSQYGLVNLESEDSVEISASFFSFQQQIDFSEFIDQVKPTSDSCTVSSMELTAEFPTEFGGSIVTGIGAGDVITVSSPAGSYTELLKNERFGFIFYTIEEGVSLSAPAPNGLSLSIPGDVFPAFTNVAFPPIDPLLVNSPVGFDLITPNTSFSWNASSNPESFIEISAISLPTGSGEIVSLECTVLDDGSFTFPAEIQTQMGDFSGFGSLSREVVSILQTGSSVLAVTSSSEQ